MIVFVPVKPVPEMCFSMFGFVSFSSVKLCIEDLSVTVILYVPGLSVLTFLPAFVSEIEYPGPTVPLRLVTVAPRP